MAIPEVYLRSISVGEYRIPVGWPLAMHWQAKGSKLTVLCSGAFHLPIGSEVLLTFHGTAEQVRALREAIFQTHPGVASFLDRRVCQSVVRPEYRITLNGPDQRVRVEMVDASGAVMARV